MSTTLFRYLKNLIQPQIFEKNLQACTKLNRLTSKRSGSTTTKNEQKEDFFKEEMALLKAHYPTIVEDLVTSPISKYKPYPGFLEGFYNFLDYTVPNENSYFLATALIPLYTYRAVEDPEKLTPENLKMAAIMSWAYRILEVTQIIMDDIMDHDEERYNKPTWYKKEGNSVEKSLLQTHYLCNGAFLLLCKYLRDHPCSLDIIKLYLENNFLVCITQLTDYVKVGINDLPKLSSLRFDKPLYFFDGPVKSGLFMANIKDKEVHKAFKKFADPMSRFTQIQNDFTGAFGQKEKFQRVCTDAISGRNSWMVVTALELASPAQRKIIEENYGKGNVESAKKISEIYRELKLDEAHEKASKEFAQTMFDIVESFPQRIPKKPFHDLVNQLVLNMIYS